MNQAVPSHTPWRNTLRPRLGLALLITSLLAVWALWTTPDDAALPRARPSDSVQPSTQPNNQPNNQPSFQPNATVAPPAGHAGLAGFATGPQGRAAAAQPVLPAALDGALLEAALHDPFAGTAPAPPRLPPQPTRNSAGQANLPITTAVPAPDAPATPPAAPTLNYRFMARITNPAGAALTFVAKGDQVLQVQVGQTLDEGYVVESVDDRAVHLHYPPLDVRAVIAIAPAGVAPSYLGAR